MQCIRPLKAGFDYKGNIVFSQKQLSPQFEPFAFDCRKCLPCRLNIAREKAIRCIHEAKMHKNNMFLTLTYNDQNLKSPKLQYIDFQLFMKKLRDKITENITDKDLKEKLRISYMVTGEYGDKNKRPHWHAIVFNYIPPDAKYKYTTDLKQQVFTSQLLTDLWGKGNIEFGSVTFESAGYVARYAAKKLVHGADSEHDFHPIHKTSSKRAIGRSWIEKYYKHTFENGFVILPNGQKSKIPRYYVDWLKKYHQEDYLKYTSTIRATLQEQAKKKARIEELNYCSEVMNNPCRGVRPLTRSKIKETVLKQKFKQLQERLKL